MIGGEGCGFSNLLYCNYGQVGQSLHQRIGVSILLEHSVGSAFMQGNQQRSSLAQFGLEHSKVALDRLESRVVNLGCLVMHGYQILIVLPDLLVLGLVSRLKCKLLQQLSQSDRVADILRPEAFLERLKLSHIAKFEPLLYFSKHHLLSLYS